MPKLLLILLIVAGYIVLSCTPDAPRSNPLDPYHQVTVESGGQMSGYVLRKTAPFSPLLLCNVYILPENKFTTTDEQGRFLFSGIQTGDHTFIAYKPGYDSLRVDIPADSSLKGSLFLYMNAKPLFKNVSIYSEYIDQWWPDPVAFLNAELIADDPDGINDLAEIYLTIGRDSAKYNFTATASPDSFSLRIDQLALPGQNIVSLVGEKIYIHLRDSSGSSILDGPHQLVRVLNDSPLPVSPTALETTAPHPILNWKSYFAAFSFTFEISVFHVSAGIPVRIFYRRSLPPEQTQFTFPDSLSSGTYFWTVGVRDRFQDLIRSKEASFIVP